MASMRLVGLGIVALAFGLVIAVVFLLVDSGAFKPSPSATAAVPSALASAIASAATQEPTAAPTPSGSEGTPVPSDDGPTLAQLVGQKLVVRMDGATPSADLLGRIARGEVGGVILFGPNVTTPAALVALTGQLRDAAVAGGQPALMIAVDQEGGPIKRIKWAPPTLSVPQMGDDGTAATAQDQGEITGAALHDLGIDVDLAPVADVPATATSFMYLGHRTFSFDATSTALLADAFATGLESGGIVPTMKHFPGLGLATRNTDASVVTIKASTTALDPGLQPYRTAIANDIPMIMLSNATYTAYDPDNGAGWSAAIVGTLLRDDLGFTGVTITDSLSGTAKARKTTPGLLAIRAAQAGTDMILVTGSEAQTRAVYAALLSSATAGAIPMDALLASYDRILALKAGF